MSSLMRVKSYGDETQGKRILEILDGFFLDHFSDLLVTFLGPFSLTITDYSWVGRWTINTQGKVGGRLKVLREGWEADYHVYRKHET